MEIQITCPECGSGINVLPSVSATAAKCDVCTHIVPLTFTQNLVDGKLCDCPVCLRKDFYQQKDFNRVIGAALFIFAACLVPWTYGLSLLALYLLDVFLFRKLNMIAVCYKCKTIFRSVANLSEIRDYDHEMNDRIVYSDHDFQGKPLKH
ncbi:MAG: hypothetical protein K2P81_15330 [Bacteriovoracaceae bacterium]|nr:hypothetical protein [Bacteriovoracaceae bacterium]